MEPIVKRRKELVEYVRKGRGFSRNELKEAGLTVAEAKRLGLRVDPRRRSTHPENVKMLKQFMKRLKKEEEKAKMKLEAIKAEREKS
ncbi:50S ribosomal protein L13e [Candidatus Bathyarchaeota archaeon ex4484_205]|nr:MAG: 50S ribosomal protein L13e [Candidatus Bathyarchaeota archaeon ex4484_205]